MIRKVLTAIIILSAFSLFFTLPQPFMFIGGLLQTFILPGLVFLMFTGGSRFSRSDQIFFSILISPILLSILVVAATVLTGDIYLSLRVVLSVSYVLLLTALLFGKHRQTASGYNGLPRPVFLVALLYGGMILISYLANDFLLIRSDAWYHAAVVREVIQRGIPPHEPLLADFQIRYMWFYHLFQACWIKLSGLSLFPAMGFFNIINAFVFPYMVARFTSFLTGKRYLIISSSLLALVGLQAASWVFWPTCLVKLLTGNVKGMLEFADIILNVTVSGVTVTDTLAPFGTWMVSVTNKFLTVTAFGYSFNLFLGSLILVLRRDLISKANIRSALILFVIMLGTFLFHVVTGIVMIATIIGSTLIIYMVTRWITGGSGFVRENLLLLVVAVLVAMIVLPYFFALVSGGSGRGASSGISKYLHLGVRNIFTFLLPLLVFIYPVTAALKKLFSSRDYVSLTVAYWIVCLVILSTLINIGIVGEKKLVYLLLLVMGPPVYIQIAFKVKDSRGLEKVALISLLSLLFLFPLILTFRGYIIHEPGQGIEGRRYDITEEDRRFLGWIEENTPDNAVIMENNIYHLPPVYAGRRNFYSWYNIARVLYHGSEGIEWYREIQNRIYSDDIINQEFIDEIRDFEYPLYIAVWREDIESRSWLATRFDSKLQWFEKVYSSPKVELYTLKGRGR